MNAQGDVIWITGLAGSGKSTIGRAVHERLKKASPGIVFFDGDELREVFRATTHFAGEDRLALALAYARLCRLVAEQGIDVICATISLFAEVHRWNRTNLTNYFEVYLDVPMPVLQRRDPKGLYARALRGEIHDVVGVDVPFAAPEHPDIIVRNDGSQPVLDVTDTILRALADWRASHAACEGIRPSQSE